MGRVAVCPNKISAVDLRALAAAIVDTAEEYFRDPEHQRQFEEWKKEEEKKRCLKSN